jgi:hypothetical protein
MVNDIELLKKLKERYDHVDPIVFLKTVGLVETPGELFDVLEDIPKDYPIVWNPDTKKWVKTIDLYCYDLERMLGDNK